MFDALKTYVRADTDAVQQSWLKAVIVLNGWLTISGPALLGLVVLEAGWVRLALGRWPIVYHDQTTGVVSACLEALEMVALWLIFLGWPGWLASLPAVSMRLGWRTVRLRAVVFLGSLAALAIGIAVDPFRFMEWWLD